MDDAPAPTVHCSLSLEVGEKLVRLECTCPPGSEYAAANALMNEMHGRIKTARTKELTGE